MALDENSKTIVIHVAFFNLVSGIYLDRKAQIASLRIEEVKILDKYSDFANVISEEKDYVLSEYIKLNEYIINLEDGIATLWTNLQSRSSETGNLEDLYQDLSENWFYSTFQVFRRCSHTVW